LRVEGSRFSIKESKSSLPSHVFAFVGRLGGSFPIPADDSLNEAHKSDVFALYSDLLRWIAVFAPTMGFGAQRSQIAGKTENVAKQFTV
jgi:hypothetical protein